ncbi:hypothetical protein VN12_05020 [Pirellula sp. SH-Sr6A]|uniref:PEP-CTERM sorting domain-containing protein n=1 Tax=Pirellula sp. SH-Sr6A TaxID=1632865 RepID=UPI00078DA0DA|nr:PEP-CTERM sorting domain-containing protein [Pirellula sp. SH-Sr6A]AMV31458.1 hypothetical protein VN12_05020 [Pirellula sp. SH-Sr6A]
MSFLIRRNSTAGDFGGFGGIYLDGTENDLFIGKPGASNVWSLENRGGGGLAQSNYTATVGQTTRLVLRIQVQNAAEAFALYVDPSTEQEPVSPSVRKVDLNIGQLTDIVLYTSGDFSYDEIRFGDTFASVTAVPEPSALALALVSMTGLSCVAAFRRKSLPRTAKKESTARVD